MEEKTNRREGKKPSDKYQNRIKKNIKNIISQQKKKDKVKRKEKKMTIIKEKIEKAANAKC